jgi:serine/threonine-protein phosphatase 4 regulatory subunit 1
VQFVTPEIISLSEDPVFRVRKATALNIDNVCRTAGPLDTMERLLPAYLRLTKVWKRFLTVIRSDAHLQMLPQDDIWGVRKACAESLCAISNAVDESVRVGQLVQVSCHSPCMHYALTMLLCMLLCMRMIWAGRC